VPVEQTNKKHSKLRKMSTKFTIIACAGVFLSGCAMFTPATESRYVSADGQLQIRGELVDSTAVKIFVNDNKVIDEHVSLLRGDGEFAGTYEGKRVTVDCSTAGGRKLHGTTCMVAVGGERVRLSL
jgi:type 1 fimbria pilin